MTDEVFARIEAALLARGFARTGGSGAVEAFGSQDREYGREGEGLRLVWDGRDGWFVLQGGHPWRDLVVHRPDGAGEDAITRTAETLLAASGVDRNPSRPAAERGVAAGGRAGEVAPAAPHWSASARS